MHTQPLYFRHQPIEKTAGYKMPANPRLWQAEIIRYLKSQHPYLPLDTADIDLRRMDAVKGAAVGSVILGQELAVPVIISRPRPGADPELAPMDVFFHQGRYHFLDPDTIRGLTHNPRIGEPEGEVQSRAVGGNPYIGDVTGDATPLEYSGQASPFAGPFDGTKLSSLWLPEALMAKEALSDEAKERAAQAGALFGLTGGLRGLARGAAKGVAEGTNKKQKLIKAIIGAAQEGGKGAASGAAVGTAAGAATPSVRKSLGIEKKEKRRETQKIKQVVQKELEKESAALEHVLAEGLVAGLIKNAFLDPNDVANFRELMATNPHVLQGSGSNHNLIELMIRRGPDSVGVRTRSVTGPNIVQVFNGPMGGIFIKFSGGPEQRTSREELKSLFGDRFGEVMSKLKSGHVFMQHDGLRQASWSVSKAAGRAKPVIGDGMYAVRAGRDSLVGLVIPSMYHFDGRELPRKLLVSTDGRYAISGEMFGVKLSEKHRIPSKPPASGETGVFVNYVHGTPISTVPLKLTRMSNVVVDEGQKAMKIYHVQDPVTGENFAISPAEGVQGFERLRVFDSTSEAAFGTNNVYYMPASAEWVPLRSRIDVTEREEDLEKVSSAEDVTVTSDGALFTIDQPFTKTAYLNMHDFEAREALVGMGMSQDDAETVMEEALRRPGQDRGIKIAGLLPPQGHGELVEELSEPSAESEKFASACRPGLRLIKAAAESGMPETLDAILSLEFITPQNIRYFIDNIPDLEETASRMAALLISVRLGMKHVPEQAVKDALEGLSQTVSKLKILKSAMESKRSTTNGK